MRPREGFVARIRRQPVAALLATGLLAAGVCLGLAFAPRDRSGQEFLAKSADPTSTPGRWAGIQTYRVRAGKSERLSETLSRADGLLFSYTNLGPEPLANLMIFAVDSHAEVHWFHPASKREGTNPSSISIDKGVAQVPLAELIQDEFPSGPLAIHALFSDRPLQVLEVEAWLKHSPGTSLAPHLPGGVDQMLTIRVE